MIDSQDALAELGRLRNRHVAKVLTFLGEVPPYLERAIKTGFNQFAEDVEANIIIAGQSESKEEEDHRDAQER